jgi:hypothetical protein
LVVAAAIVMSPAFARLQASTPDPVPAAAFKPREVLAAFMEAVDRGELRVFGKVVERSMITPRRVEFIYDLYDLAPSIKVYSRFAQPIPVPGQDNCEARAVGALMSADGHIIDTEVHIWMGHEECSE